MLYLNSTEWAGPDVRQGVTPARVTSCLWTEGEQLSQHPGWLLQSHSQWQDPLYGCGGPVASIFLRDIYFNDDGKEFPRSLWYLHPGRPYGPSITMKPTDSMWQEEATLTLQIKASSWSYQGVSVSYCCVTSKHKKILLLKLTNIL